IEDHHDRIEVPAYNVGAWYDIFLGGTLRNYVGLKAHGGSEAARHGQRLLIDVGGHAGPGPNVGEVVFGSQVPIDHEGVLLREYDSCVAILCILPLAPSTSARWNPAATSWSTRRPRFRRSSR